MTERLSHAVLAVAFAVVAPLCAGCEALFGTSQSASPYEPYDPYAPQGDVAAADTREPVVAVAVVAVTVTGPSGSPGLEPGRTASLTVELENTGTETLSDLTSTLEATTALITDVADAGSGPHYLPAGGRTRVTDADITVSPDAEPGAPLTLVLHLRDGKYGNILDLPIALPVERHLARLVVSRVEAEVNGEPAAALQSGVSTRVSVYVRNIGLTSTQDAVVTATLQGPVDGTLEGGAISYCPPDNEVLAADGRLTRTGSGAITATLQLEGANLPSLTQDLPL